MSKIKFELLLNWLLLFVLIVLSFIQPYSVDKNNLGSCTVYFNPMLFMCSFIMALICSFQLMRTFLQQKKAAPFLLHYVVPLMLSLSIGIGVYKHLSNNIDLYQEMLCK